MLESLFSNFPLWTSVITIFFAQLLKVPWNYFTNHTWDWRWLANSGGMPSGHTSAATSLATSIGLTSGWESPSFAIATIFSIVVMYDATGVRRHAGMQAQVINQLADDFTRLLIQLRHQKEAQDPQRTPLKEILGHQPIEVFTGLWFGIAMALICYYIWW
ncbi:hypothetical protein SAMN05444392_103244 [Seinonella peptonophila]|uniref:Divergent PAP2 family protein n=1 Tax=Seinonella peptonophila TaxID=112248 RepID=A0A1M4WIY4_9BACL|nr:divergent PAP2 family protein [Seinonella peptonophila]SHE81198.1 hypothetical protein SAMN05444392_103244 [Seinonella peptonophila]